MTTVAALATGGAVYMAADSMTNVYDRPVPSVTKVRRLPIGGGGECLIAVCGDGGLADMVTDLLSIDDAPASGADPQPWAAAVSRACTALAVEQGFTDGGRMDGTLLLGWNGRLWSMPHGQAIAHPDGVAALGSGEGPAIGAIDALMACDCDREPADVVVTAVRIAIERDKHSGGPVHLEVLPAI